MQKIIVKQLGPVRDLEMEVKDFNLLIGEQATGKSTVAESFTARSVRYSPYRSYVGIRLGETAFETDSDLNFPVVCVDAEGKLQAKRSLEYKIYKLNWRWWWEGSPNDLSRYVQSTSAEEIGRAHV